MELTKVQNQLQELRDRVVTLEAQVAELTSSAKPRNTSQREMTESDARAILTGEHSALSHNKAAAALGLSYGQVYSCRLEYTFAAVHKELSTQGFKNPWKK